MAIAVESTAAGTGGQAGTTISWSHTIGVTANKLVVTVILSSIGTDPSGITAGGVALTKRTSENQGGERTGSIWSLDNPPTGSVTIVVTKADGAACEGGSIAFSGAKAGVGADDGQNTTSANPSLTLATTGSGNGFVVDFVVDLSDVTVGAGQTQIWKHNGSLSTSFNASSYEPYTGGSNPTMSWTAANNSWAMGALEIQEDNSTTLNLSESVAIVERFSRSWTAVRGQSDSVGISDSAGASGNRLSLSDSVPIVDTVTRVWISSRVLSETSSIIESISAQVQVIRTLVLSEVMSIVDTVRTPLNWLKRIKPSTIWTKRTKP